MQSRTLNTKGYDFRKTRRWQALRRAVLQRDGYVCHWCGMPATEADHVIPAARSHPALWHDMGNLVASCTRCNRSRSHEGRATHLVSRFRPVFRLGAVDKSAFRQSPPADAGYRPVLRDYGRKSAG